MRRIYSGWLYAVVSIGECGTKEVHHVHGLPRIPSVSGSGGTKEEPVHSSNSRHAGWFVVVWTAVLIVMPVAVRAQIETGSIVGAITDETGGALPGVTVTVRNLATGQVRTVTTNELGRYQAMALQPSRYSVTAELQGFSTVVRPEITVNVGASVDVPVTMKVGAMAETVTVTGEAALVQSQKTELSTVVNQQAMEALPSKQRAYLDFTLLMPATVENVSQVQGTGAVIGGTRSSQGTLLVDGFYNLDEGFAMPKQQQSQDSIQEFQVVSFGGSAEYGRAIGGVINAVTKSGGNEVRGSGYGFFRNTNLNAQDWGEKARGTPKTDYNRQLFGGTVGGPIKRNKNFFFASYERLDETWPVDNRIKASDAAAIGLPAADVGTVPRYYKKNFAMTKVDHNISETQRLQGQFSWTRYTDQQMCCLATLATRSAPYALHPTDFLYMVKWTSIPAAGGKLLQEVKGSYFPRKYGAWGLQLGGPPLVPDGQINTRPSSNASPPRVSISSVATFGSASLDNWIETYPAAVIYTASRFTQKHSVKFGADYMYAYYDYSQYHPLRGSYSFASLANFLIGRYNTYSQAFGDTWNPRTHQYLSGFVQDSWTPSNRFTVNYGLRYDLELNPKQKKSGVPYGNDYNNLGPRFALSYGLTDSGKTFLKLTTGVYYDRIWNNFTNNLYSLKDHELRQSYTWSLTTPGAPVYPNVFTSQPANLPVSIHDVILMPLKVNVPANAQVVGTFEHSLSSNLAVSSSIVYTRTWYRDITWDTNQQWDSVRGWYRPDPAYRQINQTLFIAPAEYLGGIAEVTRRGTTFGFQGNITVARALQTIKPPNQQFGVVTDLPSIEQVLEWGPNSDTPTVRGVVSGWYNVSKNIQLSGAFTGRSGRAYSASAAGLDLDGDGNFGDRTPRTTYDQFRFGNSVTIDGRFVWVVPLANERKLQFYVEGFNLANRINVRTVQTDMGQDMSNPKAIFGTPLSYFAPREVQLGVRLQF